MEDYKLRDLRLGFSTFFFWGAVVVLHRMRPKIEIDPALGGLESSSIASLLPGLGLEPAVDGEQVKSCGAQVHQFVEIQKK